MFISRHVLRRLTTSRNVKAVYVRSEGGSLAESETSCLKLVCKVGVRLDFQLRLVSGKFPWVVGNIVRLALVATEDG